MHEDPPIRCDPGPAIGVAGEGMRAVKLQFLQIAGIDPPGLGFDGGRMFDFGVI